MDKDLNRAKVRRSLLWLTLSLALSAGILSYLLERVPPALVLNSIKDAYLPAMLTFGILSMLTSLIRTWRYFILLQIAGQAAPRLALFLLVLVRNLFADLLPAKIGSLVYIFLVNTRLGVNLAAAGSSFALAAVFDVMAIAPIIFVAAISAGSVQQISLPILLILSLLLALGAIILIVTLPKFLQIAQTISQQLKIIPQKNKLVLANLLQEMRNDINQVQAAGKYPLVFALSLLVRALKYCSLYTLLYALLRPVGYELASLHPGKIFLGLCASELMASTPVSGIAGFGAYQGAWVLTFSLLGFPRELAELTSLSHHIFSQAWGYSLGILALILLCSPLFALRKIPS